MYLHRLLSVCLILVHVTLTGQVVLSDDFEDGNLDTNPTWVGDLDDYSALDGQLQLSATEAGTSSLFTAYDRVDSVSIAVAFDINTNPSGGNFSRIYLYVDRQDLSLANGYYLQLGEGGSDDAIELIQLVDGQPSSVARGDMAGLASRPAKALAIDIRHDGTFTLTSTDLSSGAVSEEIITVIDWSSLSTSGFFGVLNTYTGSNVTNYSYDDVLIQRFTPDLEAPVLLSAEAIDATTVALQFDEEIGNTTLTPAQVSFDPDLPVSTVMKDLTRLVVDLGSPLQSVNTYTITVSDISDLLDNTGVAQTTTLQFAETPVAGDLVINEILFNPEGDGSDYVEILNVSNKRLALDGLLIRNTSNDNEEVLSTDLQLEPQGIALVTEDALGTAVAYPSNDDSVFIENRLPPFNNGDGNVSIIAIGGQAIDSVDYDEDWHFSLLDDVDGVSLERIDPSGPSQAESNWQSAASASGVGFGTPGLGNSAFIGRLPVGEGLLQVIDDTFSPDLDGEDEQIAIQYDLPSNGYLANAFVYDQRGHLVRNLYNQELLGVAGILTWDGLDDSGRRLPVGPYIIRVQLFNLDGDRIEWQAPVVLAVPLD
jgi:hypothetical protein